MKIKIIFFFLALIVLETFAKYTTFECSNLRTYKKYLEKAKPGILEKHPKCNAFAIRAAKKTRANEFFWTHMIEPAYRKYFGHPSAVFRKCEDCQSPAPKFSLRDFKKINRKYVLVLSIDGGGVRGLIPARVLQHIEQKVGVPIIDIFDIYVGTSTGGLISLILTTPDEKGRPKYTADDLVQMYKDLARSIFYKSSIFSIRGWRSRLGFTSSYSAKPYEQLLKKYFSNTLIQQAIKPVLVTSIDVNRKMPVYISSVLGFNTLKDLIFMWEAGRATSAAPLYFKPLALKEGKKTYLLADGGVGINNPVLLGILMAKKMFPDKKVVVVSLSTQTKPADVKFAHQGAFGGGPFHLRGLRNLHGIIDNLMSVPGVANDKAVKVMMEAEGGAYYRIESDISANIAMDDSSPAALKELDRIAQHVIDRNIELKTLIVVLPTFIKLRKKLNQSHQGKHRPINSVINENIKLFEKLARDNRRST